MLSTCIIDNLENKKMTEIGAILRPAPTSTKSGQVTSESASNSFPVGYHKLHPDVSVNFQLNRFYGWVGGDSMLTEMREAAVGVHDYPTFTKTFLE